MKNHELRAAQNRKWVAIQCPECNSDKLCYYEFFLIGWGTNSKISYRRSCGECSFSQKLEKSRFKKDKKKNQTHPFEGEAEANTIISWISTRFKNKKYRFLSRKNSESCDIGH